MPLRCAASRGANMRPRLHPVIMCVASLSLAACATASATHADDHANDDPNAAYASTYTPRPAPPTLIRNATVFDGDGHEFANTDVLFQDAHIVAVGQNLTAPAGAEIVDGAGKFVTPGIIDPHSHLGVYPSPSIEATQDGNELTGPNTAEVWSEHSI